MVRPKIMDNMKITTISLDESDIEIVEKERGDLFFSEYIRNLIRETQTGAGRKTNSEKILKKQLRAMKAKLNRFERKERAITQEHRDAMTDISKGYNNRLLTFPNATLGQQRNWLEAQCKGMGIGLEEMMAYINNPDIFGDKGIGKKGDIKFER